MGVPVGGYESGRGTLVQHLDDESAEGWDLVTVIPGDGAGSHNRLVLRREVTNPTWDQ